MMAGVITQRIPVAQGVSLHTEVWPDGAGRPFLLVHGLASNCRTWRAVAERLHEAGHSVAAVDLRGHGQSDKPDDGYDFATLTSDLVGVIDGLSFTRPVVAGQSTGGNLALALGHCAPEQVAGVSGIDGGVLELADEFPRWEDCEEALAPPRMEGVLASDLADGLRKSHPDWSEEGVAATLANYAVLADGTVQPWLTFDRHIRILRALWEQRPSALVPTLAVPLLLVLADSDDGGADGKRRSAERAKASGTKVRVEWLSGDHDLHVQKPAVVADLLLGAVSNRFFPP